MLRTLEVGGIIIGFILLVTQLAVPLLTGRPVFPWFRRTNKAEKRLAVARESVDVAALEHEAADLEKRAGGEEKDGARARKRR